MAWEDQEDQVLAAAEEVPEGMRPGTGVAMGVGDQLVLAGSPGPSSDPLF